MNMSIHLKVIIFLIDDEKLLEKYKAIWIEIKDLKNIEQNALPVHDDKLIWIYMYKTKVRTYRDKAYTNFLGSSVSKN